MAYEVIVTKQFQKKFYKLLYYTESEWGTLTADKTEAQLYDELEKLQVNPHLGSLQGRKNVRSIIFSKHNRLYYRIQKKRLSLSIFLTCVLILNETHTTKSKLD
jgi:plasmid stabilization system protein ParE